MSRLVPCSSVWIVISHSPGLRFKAHAEAMKHDLGMPQATDVELHEQLQGSLGRVDTQEAQCMRRAQDMSGASSAR